MYQWLIANMIFRCMFYKSFPKTWVISIRSICDRAWKNRTCGLLKFDYTFQTFGSHNFLFQYGIAIKFSELVDNLFGFTNFLTESNYYTFQYWDISHQMTWYILAHMPYFCRPGHIYKGCIKGPLALISFAAIHIVTVFFCIKVLQCPCSTE